MCILGFLAANAKNKNQTFAKLVRHLFGFMMNTHGESVSNKLKLGFETSINENEILVSEHAHTHTHIPQWQLFIQFRK